MTKDEAEKYLYWFNNDYKDRRAVTAHFPSTSLAMSESDRNVYETVRKAKIVLGKHPFQRTFEQLKKVHPQLTLEMYHYKRRYYGIE